MTVAGNCLCGAVRILAATPPRQVTECNCSACRRYGTLWAYYPPRDVRIEGATVSFTRGEASLEFHHCGTVQISKCNVFQPFAG